MEKTSPLVRALPGKEKAETRPHDSSGVAGSSRVDHFPRVRLKIASCLTNFPKTSIIINVTKAACFNCFQSLSVPARFQIFQALNHSSRPRSLTVSDLANLTSLSQPTVTFHLNQLENSGLIKRRKRGRQVFCQISPKCPHCQLFSD
jgi:hypothetical protein